MNPEYCRLCGQRLQDASGLTGIASIIMPSLKPKNFEFDDGVYCEKCAKLHVERRRRTA